MKETNNKDSIRMLYSIKRILERYSKIVTSKKVSAEYKRFYFILECIYKKYSDQPLNKEYEDFNITDFNKRLDYFIKEYQSVDNLKSRVETNNVLNYDDDDYGNSSDVTEEELTQIYMTIRTNYTKLTK